MGTTKRRRRQGEGTVYHDAARGRWVGAVTIGGSRRKVTVPGAKSDKIAQGDCKRRLRDLIDGIEAGPVPDASADAPAEAGTVAEVVDVFLKRELPARQLAPATVAGYRWACGLIVDRIGWYPVAALTAAHVEDFYDTLASGSDGPATAASLRKVRTTLHQVLNIAERRYGIRNVAAVAKLPPAAGTRPRRALTPDEARRLLQQLHHEPYGLLFGLSLRLGLRPGEATALSWADVDGDVLHVRRGRRVVGGKVEVVDELKTTASRRSIELPADIVAWIAEHRRATFGEVVPLRLDGLLMFPSATGRALDPSNMRRELEEICERAGVPVVRPNELRHSCASLLSDEGVPNELIADLLGHTTTRMVDETYRHRLRPVVDVAARAGWATA